MKTLEQQAADHMQQIMVARLDLGFTASAVADFICLRNCLPIPHFPPIDQEAAVGNFYEAAGRLYEQWIAGAQLDGLEGLSLVELASACFVAGMWVDSFRPPDPWTAFPRLSPDEERNDLLLESLALLLLGYGAGGLTMRDEHGGVLLERRGLGPGVTLTEEQADGFLTFISGWLPWSSGSEGSTHATR